MHVVPSRAQSARWFAAAVLATAAALVAIVTPRAATAQATLLAGLGGPHGFGTNYLPENDDGFSSAIDVTPAFPGGLRFFAPTPFTTVYVNNNGNITFREGLYAFTPDPFPVADQPMIAPWWGDVDTRSGGVPTGEGVFWDLRPGQFTVTWWNVGYYAEHNDLRNSFQMIIRAAEGCGLGSFDVEFRYNQCQWTTGDASDGVGGLGGTPAQAGFDAGDRVNFFTLPGSRTMAVLNLCTTSNVGMPGVWRFRIRGGALPCMGSGDPCTISTNVGACQNGTLQCRGAGTACVQSTMPAPERCDGVDNDCNGMVDDGAMLCNPGEVCDRGACVPRCVEGGCFAGQTCTDRGTCVETSCATVTCPAGQRCSGGMCVDACSNVYCPGSLVCRAGRCVDLCAGMMCGDGEVCEEGICQPNCMCRTCPMGDTCQSDGRCVPTACVGVMCGAGTVCRSGMCVDACTPPTPDMRVCGVGEHCEAGRCVPGTVGPDGGTSGDAGGDASSSGDGGFAGDAGGDVVRSGDGGGFGTTSGCGCRTAGGATGGRGGQGALLGLAALAALAALARRRKRA